MPLRYLEPLPLPHRWQCYLNKLLNKLKGRRVILASLPTIDQLAFQEMTYLQQNSIGLQLGRRKQADGTQKNVWAIVLFGRKQMQPPVVFVDEINTSEGVAYHPRAATSLLRRADGLQPPFCFLQLDICNGFGKNRVKKIRDMLCALVLYQYLTSELNNCAMRWNKFDVSLICALSYVGNRFEYQYWLRNGFTYESTLSTEAKMERNESIEGFKDMQLRLKRKANELNRIEAGSSGVTKKPEVAVSSIDLAKSHLDKSLTGNMTFKSSEHEENPNGKVIISNDIVGREQHLLDNLNSETFLVVRPRIGSKALTEITGDTLPTRRQMVPDSDAEDDRLEIEGSE